MKVYKRDIRTRMTVVYEMPQEVCVHSHSSLFRSFFFFLFCSSPVPTDEFHAFRFAPSRTTLLHASSRLRNAAGNVYYNDKCTGAVVGQQPFGGARASGTNDKSGSGNVFWRFVSVRSVKDSLGGLGAGVDSQGKTAGLEVEYLSNKV